MRTRDLRSRMLNSAFESCLARRGIWYFKSYCPDTQTHTDTGPTTLPGTLKWSIKTCKKHCAVYSLA